MDIPIPESELAAIAARRADLARADADRRAARLAAARQREETLFAEADRLAILMGGLLRRFKKEEPPHRHPTALRRPARVAREEAARRDAA